MTEVKKIISSDEEKIHSLEDKARRNYERWVDTFARSLIDAPATGAVLYTIFKYKGKEGLSVKQIARLLNMKITAIYHHISKLKEANLVVEIEDQKDRFKRKRYFENRPDIWFELIKQKYTISKDIIKNAEIDEIINDPEAMKKFRDFYYTHHRENYLKFADKEALRRNLSVIFASAFETDKHLEEITKENYDKFRKNERPYISNMLFNSKEEYEEIINKFNNVIEDYIQKKREKAKNSIEHDQENVLQTPYTLSIMGMPPLVPYRFENGLESLENGEENSNN